MQIDDFDDCKFSIANLQFAICNQNRPAALVRGIARRCNSTRYGLRPGGSPEIKTPMASTSAHVVWWEPRWSFPRRQWRELQPLLSVRSWSRIVVVTVTLTVPIAIAVHALVPGLQFNWVAAFLISIAALVLYLLFYFVLFMVIPPLIFVTPKGFGWWDVAMLHQGFHYFLLSDLQSAQLTIRDDGKHYLRLRTKHFCRRIGLAPNVNLDRLLELLAEKLIVRDRRAKRSLNAA